jgi:malic enzyme
MYYAASLAIANATGEGELLPSSINQKVHLAVSHAVARAAMNSGVAQRQLDDDYFEDISLEALPDGTFNA